MSPRELIERLDRDGDGGLSLGEVPQQKQRLHNAFGVVDANGDVKVSVGELEAIRRSGAAPLSVDASKDQEPRVAQIGETGVHYIDPEILNSEGLATFQDPAGNIWVGRLNSGSGLFLSGHGKDFLMDEGAVSLRETYNGPEFGLDADGWAVFYTKAHEGVPQIWRSRLVTGSPMAEPLTTGSQRRQSILVSKNSHASTTRLLYVQGTLRDGQFFWLDEGEPSAESDVVRLKEVDSPRWIDDTLKFVFAESDGPEAGQLKFVDSETGDIRTITNDAGVKAFAYGWKAPEFENEILVVALVNYKAVGIWRDTGEKYWTRIVTLGPPQESRYRNFGSPEPFLSQGKSYISLVLKDANTRGRFRDSEVWILGIDNDPATRFARRVDDGRSPVMRSDPETFVGKSEIFVYYNAMDEDRVYEICRARTGMSS